MRAVRLFIVLLGNVPLPSHLVVTETHALSIRTGTCNPTDFLTIRQTFTGDIKVNGIVLYTNEHFISQSIRFNTCGRAVFKRFSCNLRFTKGVRSALPEAPEGETLYERVRNGWFLSR